MDTAFPVKASAHLLDRLDSEEVAAAMAEMLLSTPDWIHRRTERVVFVDDTVTHRRTAVDLTVPWSAAELRATSSSTAYRALLVDIAAKVPLVSFDIRDERGRPIPVLTRTQNGVLAARVLIDFAESAARKFGIRLNAGDIEDLVRVARAPQPEAEEALDRLRGGRLRDVFAKAEALEPLAETLSKNFLLICLLPSAVGERRIVKIAYEQQRDGLEFDARSRLHRIGEMFGVFNTTETVPCGSLPDGESYHMEVDAPPQVEIVSASLTSFDGTDWSPVISPAIRTVSSTNGVHLNVSRAADADLDVDALRSPSLSLTMRAKLTTWLLTAFLTTFAVLALFIATGSRLDEPAPAGTDPAALLAALVALLFVLVNQPTEHPLSARLLLPVRVGSLVAAFLPLVAAWLLAFSGREGAQRWWCWLTAASAVCAAITALPVVARLWSRSGE